MHSLFYITLFINAICIACSQELYSKGKIFNGASDQPGAKISHRKFIMTGKKLGKGGFGEVYQATSREDGTMWALKFALDERKAFELLKSSKHGNELYGNPVYFHFDHKSLKKSFVATPLVPGVSLQKLIEQYTKSKLCFSEFLQDHIFGCRRVLDEMVRRLHNKGLIHNDLWLHGENILVEVDIKREQLEVDFIDFDMLTQSKSKLEKTYELITFLNMVANQFQDNYIINHGKHDAKDIDWNRYDDVEFYAVLGRHIVFNEAKLDAFRSYIFESDVFQKMLKREDNVAILGLEKLDPSAIWTFSYDVCSKKAHIMELYDGLKPQKLAKPNSKAPACKPIIIPRSSKDSSPIKF